METTPPETTTPRFTFTKEKRETTKGMQASVYDQLLPEFTEPGDTLYFDESVMKRTACSQAAKRLTLLDGKRKFHSGYDAVKKQAFIRVRPEGEVPDKGDDDKVEASDPEAEAHMESNRHDNPCGLE